MALELTVVTGSTGKHGGSVAQGLLERSHKVRAVSGWISLYETACGAPLADLRRVRMKAVKLSEYGGQLV